VQAAEAAAPPGLPNLGNSCYMGAVLQCLLNLPGRLGSAIEVFDRISVRRSGEGAVRVCAALSRLAAEYRNHPSPASKREPLSGEADGALATLKEALGGLDTKYALCEQQDAYEFLGCVLEALDDGLAELLRRYAKRVPPEGVVKSIFGVATYSLRKCLQCSNTVEADRRTEVALGLPLISPAAQFDASRRLAEELVPVSLLDLLREAVRPEILEDYECGNCQVLAQEGFRYNKRSRLAQRSGLLSGAGEVLVIALYRFLNIADAEGNFGAVKLRRPVSIPTTLRLAVGSYSLCSIVSHSGEELSSGHYTAAVRCPADGTWYTCDDAHVDPIRSQKLYDEDAEVTRVRQDADPFILFYHRRGDGKAAAGDRP